jgi:glutathione S-transferase
LGGIGFKDTRHKMPDWPKVKGDPDSPPAKMFGSMPVIVHGKTCVAQSMACAQYAADLGMNKALAPSAQQRGLDTMILGAHADLQATMYKCLFGDDESKAKGKEALPGGVAPILAGIERQYRGTAEKGCPFLYSSEPSLGDLAVLDVVTSPFPGLKALGVDLSPYPKILACVEACQKRLDSGGAYTVAAPAKSAPSGPPELIYFAGPGRAELTRLAFHAGGVAFKDTRVNQPDWPALKGDPSSAPGKMFGSMPVIVHGEHMMAQSRACAQYAADLGINAGATLEPAKRAMDMMMLGAHADLQTAMYKCLFGDEESKKKGKEALVGNVTPTLQGIERQYAGPGPFLYAPETAGPTLGDLALLDVVTSPFPGLRALQVDLTPYPKIQACVSACQTSTARPGLKVYLENRFGSKQ